MEVIPVQSNHSTHYLIRPNTTSNRYRYFGDWPNQQISPTAGAWHGSEIGLIFGGTADLVPGKDDTPAEAALSKVMQGGWAAFAKDPVNGLSKYGWPTYNSAGKFRIQVTKVVCADRNYIGKTLVQLGYNNGSGATFEYNIKYDAGCPLYDGLAPLLSAIL
jgi:cholinesterase